MSEKQPISELLRREVAGDYEFDDQSERNTAEIIERSAELLAIVEAAKTHRCWTLTRWHWPDPIPPCPMCSVLRSAGEEPTR